MQATLPAIAVAYRGRLAMMRAVFGSASDNPTPGPPRKSAVLTPKAFDAMFENARMKPGQKPN